MSGVRGDTDGMMYSKVASRFAFEWRVSESDEDDCEKLSWINIIVTSVVASRERASQERSLRSWRKGGKEERRKEKEKSKRGSSREKRTTTPSKQANATSTSRREKRDAFF